MSRKIILAILAGATAATAAVAISGLLGLIYLWEDRDLEIYYGRHGVDGVPFDPLGKDR
jgi:hypothetical protein